MGVENTFRNEIRKLIGNFSVKVVKSPVAVHGDILLESNMFEKNAVIFRKSQSDIFIEHFISTIIPAVK